ncbi:GNAT family N-acetyltransferase [Streptomyces marincola]|uniref:GNAT family N-acetyltransferase n=1 Tax=Streptomyces marincola TaxID=2878388 RepID=A0A1W7D4M6_9ACTN|nr:GNAT family N-acetyltransferase [Streptomyces marincola]ARQ72063.1 GNAT family N-acetyltransferase [Streptomyces marincola]
MPELHLLRHDHGPALLAFERENRAYFAMSLPDRGDDWFAEFDQRHHHLLAEQAAGRHFFHVLVGSGGDILGRIDLLDVTDGRAGLGFRIAERAAHRGLATSAVRQVCALAATTYRLTTLRAATTPDNAASRTVLARTGFVPAADAALDRGPCLRFTRNLSTG